VAFFTPRNQVRNMLDAEIGRALSAGPNQANVNLGRIVALQSLLHQPLPSNNLRVENNWLDQNWLDEL
jgi:hypothetical protein